MGIDSLSFTEWDAWGQKESWWTVSEKAREQYRENQRRAQAAQAQAQATEKKFKAYDDTLAIIIQGLMKDPTNNRIIVLIADLVGFNVPSDFILSIISLIDERAEMQCLSRIKDQGSEVMDIVIKIDDKFQLKIYNWINLIYSCSLIDKERVLASLIDFNNWKCRPSAFHLFAEVLTKYLTSQNYPTTLYENLEKAEAIFENISNRIQKDMY